LAPKEKEKKKMPKYTEILMISNTAVNNPKQLNHSNTSSREIYHSPPILTLKIFPLILPPVALQI